MAKTNRRTTRIDSFPLVDTKTLPKAKAKDMNDSSETSSELSLEDIVYEALKKSNKPLRLDSILRMLAAPRREKKQITQALQALEDEGRIIYSRGAWSAATRFATVEGVLSIQRTGVGFVTQSDKAGDIYIHPLHMADAWHGDTVEVLVLPGKKGPHKEGKILRTVHRPQRELAAIATQEQRNGDWICTPADARIRAVFVITPDATQPKLQQNHLLLLEPLEKVQDGLWKARVTADLAHEETPAAQERLGKANHNIPHEFPAHALREAEQFPPHPSFEDWENRRDLQSLLFVTIDNDTAKDFDDAIFVEPLPSQDGYRLYVAIADVAHYVPAGSALDVEASSRGNSYYFPLSVEPMFPHTLSNGLCSLNPHVPRLVMVAEIDFSSQGVVKKSSFYPSVIESKARLTYTQVHNALIHKDTTAGIPENILSMLQLTQSLVTALSARREARHCLNFDLPEPEIRFDESKTQVLEVIPADRNFAHTLIEECMLAANEAVALFLDQHNFPVLYRVHPAPSELKLTALVQYLFSLGSADFLMNIFPPGKKKSGKYVPTEADLHRIMKQVANTPQAYMVNRMILRTMMQARYATENEGHYGLALRHYCHFTSPIRRYADLVIHRLLKKAIAQQPLTKEDTPAALARVADHINATERNAVEAEREVHKRLTILFLKDKTGEEIDGVVSGITDFGIFIELPQYLTEGMVRLSELKDDYYDYIPERQELFGRRTGNTFSLGQQVRVIITDVFLDRLEINLSFADNQYTPRQTKRTQPKLQFVQKTPKKGKHNQKSPQKDKKQKAARQKRSKR